MPIWRRWAQFSLSTFGTGVRFFQRAAKGWIEKRRVVLAVIYFNGVLIHINPTIGANHFDSRHLG
jgi:hypothetical protein